MTGLPHPVGISGVLPGQVDLVSGTLPGTVAEKIALQDAALRERVAEDVVRTFVRVNAAVLAIIAVMFASDVALELLGTRVPGDCLVSTAVVVALISAATVQLGAIAILMGKYLFPAKP